MTAVLARSPVDGAAESAIRAVAQDLVVVDVRPHRRNEIPRLARPSLDAGFSVLAIAAPLRIERIGVAYDGESAAEGALAAAVELVASAGDAVAYLDRDLLIVGARRGRLRRRRDAGVATGLLTHARCPLLIVPEP